MKRKKGFTLIELLVVIAIIALLLAVILPSLKAAKELASGAVSVNNQKSLSTAWRMYADDNKGNLVGGSSYGALDRADKPTPYRWIEPPLLQPIYGSARASLNYTVEQRLNGFRAGKLFAYIGSEKVYRCPGDKTFLNAPPYDVNQSYAITGLMNGEDFVSNTRVGGEFGKFTEASFRSVTLDGVSKKLTCVTKMSEIASPGNKLVFVEEDVVKGKPDANKQQYNKGSWVLLGSGYTWWDAPAGYHNKSSTVGFADGHAERHKWRDKDTVNLIENAVADPDALNNEDLRWLARAYIPKP